MGRKPKAAWRCALCSTYASDETPRSTHKRALCEDCYNYLAPNGLAWCSKGGHRVKAGDVWPGASNCKDCERARNQASTRDRSAYGREWRARNQEYVKAYATSPETRQRKAASARKRYAANVEHFRAYSRAQYQKHRPAKVLAARLWRLRNTEHSRALGRAAAQRKKLKAWRGFL